MATGEIVGTKSICLTGNNNGYPYLWRKRGRLDSGGSFELTVCWGGLAGNSAGALRLAGQPCYCQSDGTGHWKVPSWADLHRVR